MRTYGAKNVFLYAFLGAFANFRQTTINFVVLVCLSAPVSTWNNLKFYIADSDGY